MATPTRQDPYRGYNFRLEFDGALLGAFADVSGLTSRPSRLGGSFRYPNVRLQRGVGSDPLLRWWRSLGAGGQAERRNLTIVLMNEMSVPVSRWRIANAGIAKVEGPGFDAAATDVPMESLELSHEGVTLIGAPDA